MAREAPLPEDEAGEGEQTETKERQPTKRELDMQQAETIRREELAKELGIKPEDLNYVEEAADPDADPDDVAAEAERKRLEDEAAAAAAQVEEQTKAPAEEPPAEPTLIDDPSKYRVKLKIDGEERIVPLSDAVRITQKEEATNKRLEVATQLLQRAGEAVKVAEPKKEEPKPESKPPPRDIDKEADEFVSAMFGANENEAKAKLVEILKGREPPPAPATPTVDPMQIANVVKQQINIESALSAFNSAHPDIVANDEYVTWANRYLTAETGGRRLEQLAPAEMTAALSAAGKLTRQKFGLKEPAAAPPEKQASTTRQEKLAKKAEIDEVKSVSTSAASVAPRPETRESVIDEMRKARGQAL